MTEEIKCILFCLTIIGYIVTASTFFNKRLVEFQKHLLQGLPDGVIEEIEKL